MDGIDLASSNVWDFTGIVSPMSPDMQSVVVLSSYFHLLNHATLSPLLKNRRTWLLLGQPGIGKSTFLLVFAKVLMALRRPFVYSNSESQGVYYYWEPPVQGAITMGRISEHSQAFNDPGVTWLMDQGQHGGWWSALCRMFLVSSDHPGQYDRFQKRYSQHLRLLVMPLPTQDECHAVASAHNHLTEFPERYGKYGPVLRVLVSDQITSHEKGFTEALTLFDYDNALFLLSPDSLLVGSTVSPIIFYSQADMNFEFVRRWFGTRYIEDRFMFLWRQHTSRTFTLILNNTDATLCTLRGSAFESHAHAAISQCTATFFAQQSRCLHPLNSYDNIVAGVNIPMSNLSAVTGFVPRACHSFLDNRVDLTTLPTNNYLKPSLTNWGAVDAMVLLPGVNGVSADLLHMTVSDDHEVKACHTLSALIDRIDVVTAANNLPVGTIRLFFVVPSKLGRDFKRQAYKDLAALGKAKVDRMEMHSIGIEVP